MEKGVLLEADVDERSADSGHHLGNSAKVYVPHHAFPTGGFYKELGKLAVFKNGDTMFVRRGIDNNFFFHTGIQSTSDSTHGKCRTRQRTKMDEAPLGAANDRREKLVYATVQIDHHDAPARATKSGWAATMLNRPEFFGAWPGQPARSFRSGRHPCPPEGHDRAYSTQAQDWW